MEKKLKKRFIIVSIILLFVFGALIAYHFFVAAMIKKGVADYAPPPITVNVVKLESTQWNPTYSTVGSTVAVQGADISPVVSGQVSQVLFDSGALVKRGQTLVVMDTAVLQAQLNEAKASLAYDKKTYERNETLFKDGVISASDLDQARSTYDSENATVAQYSAGLAQKYIRAPFAGRLGIRSVSIGQYLNAGDVITNIQKLNPIYVNFELPEQYLQQMYIGQPVSITLDSFAGQTFSGKITAFDAKVGNDTKSITVQSTFTNNNQKMLILPGMQANVTVYLRSIGNVFAVPQQAISYSLYGNNVYVVRDGQDKAGQPDKVAQEVAVTVGNQVNNLVQVEGDLKAGDLIVVDGLAKIQANNSPVQIVNELSAS